MRIPIQVPSLPVDSFLHAKSSLRLSPAQHDYNGFYKNMHELIEEQLFPGLDRTKMRRATLDSACLKLAVPAVLISYGLIVMSNKPLRQLDLSTHHEVSKHLKASVPIDDYSQFVPGIAVYGLDLAGIKAKHNFRDRTIVMVTSYIIMGATVQRVLPCLETRL